MTEILNEFQSKLTVQLINVQAKPKIKIKGKLFPIHDIKEYSFFLQRSADQQWILSLKNTQDRYCSSVFTKFANLLYSKLQLKSLKCFKVTDNDEMPALTEFVYHILQYASISKIADVIKEHLASVHNTEMTSSVERDPELGDSVPEQFYYMLDQSMLNFFYPEEWVGYEDEHGKIVCARILCEVIRDNNPEGSKYQQMMERRYIISLGLNKTNIEVSVLQLFKFKHNTLAEHENSSSIAEIDACDGSSTSEHARQSTNKKVESENNKGSNKAFDKKMIREALKVA